MRGVRLALSGRRGLAGGLELPDRPTIFYIRDIGRPVGRSRAQERAAVGKVNVNMAVVNLTGELGHRRHPPIQALPYLADHVYVAREGAA